MTYEIEHGVPIPAKKTGKIPQWPLAELTEPGMSFFVPFGDRAAKDQRRALQSRLSAAATARGGLGKFTVRQVEGGIRVWRTA